MEAVKRAGLLHRVVLERAHEAVRDGALRRAVRPVQEDEAGRPSLAHEVLERAIDLALHLLLPDQRLARRFGPVQERQVEELIAALLTPGSHELAAPVVVEHVPEVAAGVTRVAQRIGSEELQVLAEREQAPLVAEILLHPLGNALELVEDTGPHLEPLPSGRTLLHVHDQGEVALFHQAGFVSAHGEQELSGHGPLPRAVRHEGDAHRHALGF